jgi:long-chain acyl-CoA synthetase
MKAVWSARFLPPRIIKLMREHRPTVFVAIPSMYNALLSVKSATPEDFASLRLVVSGGEPLPRATFEKFRERFGVTLNEGYGLTETSPVTNWCRPEEWRPHSVGPPLPGITERVVDPATGAVLDPGQDGEVQIKGPNVMRGYLHLPRETAACFTPDGFFRTGDMGRFDLDGHLYITGRIKDMLIIGGENVFPREIEEVLNRHPGVGESAVVGQVDPLRGELPVAFVEMKEGAAFDETDLKQWCRRSLAGYKVPDQVRRMDALPRNATGKVLRRELKKIIADESKA